MLRPGMSAEVEIDTGRENARYVRLFGGKNAAPREVAARASDAIVARPVATHREVANRPLLVVSIMLATVMQVIDTTIANVALPDMQGSLSATQDQVSRVLTSHIVAAAIATPATGWLAGQVRPQASARHRHRRFHPRFGAVRRGAGTSARWCCPRAGASSARPWCRFPSRPLLDVFPRESTARPWPWGMGVMVGPILDRRWAAGLPTTTAGTGCFLINVPVGAVALFGVLASLPADDTRDVRFDLRVSPFLPPASALQLLLDRGEQQD